VLDLTGHWAGRAALAIFAVAYAVVIAEETLDLRKSKPVMVAAGAIWILVALAHADPAGARSRRSRSAKTSWNSPSSCCSSWRR
jgi:hypothetical protein